MRVTRLRLTCHVLGFLLLLLPCAAVAADHSLEAQVGYGQGPGFLLSSTVSDFARGLPLDARFGVGYSTVDPGDALAARRVFINDGTNGTPQESGDNWDLRLDLLYDLELFEKSDTYLFAGPRYSSFTGSFRYVGGNEAFEVSSRQWGLGVGLESRHRLLSQESLALVFSAIVDYYFDAPLRGHDTAYDPNGPDTNPRPGYTFGDADAAIDQPKLVPRIMVGVQYRFG